ncbi:hypothetical protein I7I48_01657 [Histoplasma ohiense]|nr:hypothetical protein I7I48_01657 [Histoplasma ohiense (nom. inval.)]
MRRYASTVETCSRDFSIQFSLPKKVIVRLREFLKTASTWDNWAMCVSTYDKQFLPGSRTSAD